MRLGSGLGSVADLAQARGELGVERAFELDDLRHLVRVRVSVRVRVRVGVGVRFRVRFRVRVRVMVRPGWRGPTPAAA